MPATEFVSLREALGPILEARGVPEREPSLLELQAIPATAECVSQLEGHRARELVLVDQGAARASIKAQRERVEYAERRLEWALHRDALQLDRPASCWCLGYGGRNPRNRPVFTGRDIEAFDGTIVAEMIEAELLGEYCDCDDGIARRASDDAIRAETQAHYRRRKIARLFGAMRLPREYVGRNWRALPGENGKASRIVERWLAELDAARESDEGRPWLLLYGEPGHGKTTIAGGLGNEWASQGMPTLFRAMPDLLDEIRASFDKENPVRESELIEAVKTADRLILDDIGAEVPKDWVGERLYAILNYRHNERLVTVLTSNLGPSKLLDHLGERLWGRVKRMSLTVLVAGDDLRTTAA